MEIITYVLSGALQHRDSLGSGSIIHPGEIQRMSAGSGIVHSEFNASLEQPCHFLQFWIAPSERGLAPAYEQKIIETEAGANRLTRLAAPEPRETELRLAQDAEIWTVHFDREDEVIHALAPGRRAWVHLAKGAATVCGESLEQGDGLAVSDLDQVRM